jgi:hypothetical protein
MIQRPDDLDTAVSLALLQEEIEEEVPRMQIKPGISRSVQRTYSHFNNTKQSVVDDKSANLNSRLTALKKLSTGQESVFHMWGKVCSWA